MESANTDLLVGCANLAIRLCTCLNLAGCAFHQEGAFDLHSTALQLQWILSKAQALQQELQNTMQDIFHDLHADCKVSAVSALEDVNSCRPRL